MEKLSIGLIKNRGLTRRRFMTMGMLGLAGWMLSPIRIAEAALQDDLELVSHIPKMAGRDGPLLVFRLGSGLQRVDFRCGAGESPCPCRSTPRS